ncbi:MAG TPA: hypothetical protein VIN36_02670 [Thiobacillus sp.]
MSHRKNILRVLRKLLEQQGPNAYGNLDPKNILGKPADITYQHTINQLIEEGLILRAPTNEAIAFRLNLQKKEVYEAELQPWYKNSLVQWMIATVLAIAGVAIAVMSLQ